MILIQDPVPCMTTAMFDESAEWISVSCVKCANTLIQMLETSNLWSLKRGRMESTFMSLMIEMPLSECMG